MITIDATLRAMSIESGGEWAAVRFEAEELGEGMATAAKPVSDITQLNPGRRYRFVLLGEERCGAAETTSQPHGGLKSPIMRVRLLATGRDGSKCGTRAHATVALGPAQIHSGARSAGVAVDPIETVAEFRAGRQYVFWLVGEAPSAV